MKPSRIRKPSEKSVIASAGRVFVKGMMGGIGNASAIAERIMPTPDNHFAIPRVMKLALGFRCFSMRKA